MLSVVIPTQNSEEGLARTLASLVPAAAEGIVREVVVSDAGSSDGTRIVADAAGCSLVDNSGGWLTRVTAGVHVARRASWFLILAPNVHLERDWYREAASFVERSERAGRADANVATFRIAYDEFGWRPRLAERMVGFSCALFGRPLREQGLIISRRHFEGLSARIADRFAGHGDLVGRLSRAAIHMLRADAVVLPPTRGGRAAPSYGRLLRITSSGLGFPTPTGDWTEE
ncbi:MAG: glycosyltransferase [Siculibacillus sp.]|nr:glycosyltransferase [Siculibacillus sp.]